jgi:hypothetical protein
MPKSGLVWYAQSQNGKQMLVCTCSCMYWVPDYRPWSRFYRSKYRRFMRALRLQLAEYYIARGDHCEHLGLLRNA